MSDPVLSPDAIWYEFCESQNQSAEVQAWKSIRTQVEEPTPCIVTKLENFYYFAWNHTPDIVIYRPDGTFSRF